MKDIYLRLSAFMGRPKRSLQADVQGYAYSFLVFLIALALRFWLDPLLPAGFPYLTFFPAVIICGFAFGVGPGTLVAVLSGLSAWYFFITPYNAFDFSFSTLIAMSLYVFVVVTDLLLIGMMTRAFRTEHEARGEMQRMAEQQEVMAQELDHRLKNIFATINAIITLSLKQADSAPALAHHLRDRLSAMGRAALLLRDKGMQNEATVEALIERSMEPFGVVRTERMVLAGPPVMLDGQAIVALGLVFHELGTNAAKYGALSANDGQIRVAWEIVREASAQGHEAAGPIDFLHIRWRERGGPVLSPDSEHKSGFGSTLMRRLITAMGGHAEVVYAPDGAEISVSLPVSALQQS